MAVSSKDSNPSISPEPVWKVTAAFVAAVDAMFGDTAILTRFFVA